MRLHANGSLAQIQIVDDHLSFNSGGCYGHLHILSSRIVTYIVFTIPPTHVRAPLSSFPPLNNFVCTNQSNQLGSTNPFEKL